jgi:hypothetical protein
MDFDVLFAGVAVSDFKAAQGWYEHFFARPPDVVAHDEEVMWQVTERGWLYIVRNADLRVGDAEPALVAERKRVEVIGSWPCSPGSRTLDTSARSITPTSRVPGCFAARVMGHA